MRSNDTHVPRGGTIGILGGGFAGRMLAQAATGLGFHARIVYPDPMLVAGRAVSRPAGDRNDLLAALATAHGCDVLTISSEDVPRHVLESLSLRAPLLPSLESIELMQHRERERRWLESAGFHVLPWRTAASREELVASFETLGTPCVVKPQLRRRADPRPLWVTSAAEAASAWTAMRGMPTIVESAASIDMELSALVARDRTGEVVSYPCARSARDHGELAWTVLPADIPAQIAARAERLAAFVARRLDVHGLLAVELFLLRDGRLVVNELVPCPHPTYNATESACATDQFEQAIRCITGLRLGSTEIVQPAAGLVIRDGDGRALSSAAEAARREPFVRAHVYSPGAGARFTGHFHASGTTVGEATSRMLRALRGRLSSRGRPPAFVTRTRRAAQRWT